MSSTPNANIVSANTRARARARAMGRTATSLAHDFEDSPGGRAGGDGGGGGPDASSPRWATLVTNPAARAHAARGGTGSAPNLELLQLQEGYTIAKDEDRLEDALEIKREIETLVARYSPDDAGAAEVNVSALLSPSKQRGASSRGGGGRNFSEPLRGTSEALAAASAAKQASDMGGAWTCTLCARVNQPSDSSCRVCHATVGYVSKSVARMHNMPGHRRYQQKMSHVLEKTSP